MPCFWYRGRISDRDAKRIAAGHVRDAQQDRQLILSWATGHFDVEYSGKCVIMYGPRYGELVNWQAVQLTEQISLVSLRHVLFLKQRHTL